MVTTATAGPILRPAEIEDLFILPVLARGIAGQACDVIRTAAPVVTIPMMTTTPTAAWVSELAEIPTSEASFAEVSIVPKKVAGLVPISEETTQDSARDVFKLIGDRLIEHTAFRVDEALFTAQPAPAPTGLAALTDVATATAENPLSLVDTFVGLAATAEDRGAPISSWVMNPATRTELATLKAYTGSSAYLLDSTQGRRTIEGAPILTTSLVPAGTVWAIPKTRLVMVVHPAADADIDVSEHALFTRDGWMIRSRMRVGFGCTDPAAITKITVTTTP